MRKIQFAIGAVVLVALTTPTYAVTATGGNTTNVTAGYRIHTFTNSAIASTFVVTSGGNIEVLVVAGGGGGGQTIGGGGGAGGFVTNASYAVEAGSNYTVVVGRGGAGAVGSGAYTVGGGAKGSNSVFGAITAYGGGGGGNYSSPNATSGGSGGGMGAGRTGGPMAGTNEQGNAGGTTANNSNGGAGGGGAGTVGTNGISAMNGAGAGGAGLSSALSGTLTWYAGGGGGGSRNLATYGPGGAGGLGGGGAGSTNAGLAGVTNTGGGGGAGGFQGNVSYGGGAGGSGIVIVRYLFGVDNAGGATNVTATSACLNGTLYVDTPNTAVFVFWGQSDGGQDTSVWANTNIWAASQSAGNFTFQATELASGATWYYRYAVSNETGWIWAPVSSVFITSELWIEKTSDASEIGPTPGAFTVRRAAEVTNEALIVTYTVGGTATPGVDYTALSGTVTIPKGEESATITVQPIFDYFKEDPETVLVSLLPGPYVVGSPAHDTVTIADYDLIFFRLWSGDGANALASNPTNWVGGEAPIENDDIALVTGKNMTWDLNIPVQSWSQVGYTGTVSLATVYPGQGAFTNFTILGDCVISNGVWTQTANPNVTYEVNRLRVSIGGNLIVGLNGAIDVTGKGYWGGKGPGGGSEGSYGGRGDLGVAATGPCYGSIVAPINLGSGGNFAGGGAILLTVSGTITNDGLISADGAPSGSSYYTGSGGSIYLVAGRLTGLGAIRANGGYASAGLSGGGGGRVALVVTNAGADFSSYTGPVLALGNAYGAAGTVYLRTAAQTANRGTLVIDNSNNAPRASAYTVIGANVSDTVVGDVLIRNKGSLSVDANQTLTLSGVWSNTASFTGFAGSQIIFSGDSSSTSRVYGTTTFMGLICTNAAGKTLLFEAGKTTSVAALGQLTLKGSATATNLILRSMSDGTPWKLNVNGAAAQSLRYVHAKDSDASSGATIGAFDSLDQGGNLNWAFVTPGQTNAWTGAASTSWGATNNWSRGRVPLAEDFVSIPVGQPRYPVLDTAKTLPSGLEIENGASLNLAGYNLTLPANVVVAGVLTATNREMITILADADFTGSTVTAGYSTVVIGGEGNQTVNLANQPFFKINVMNSGGTVTFGAGFSAAELRCEAPDGTRSLVFQQGATVSLRSLVLLGTPTATNITLRSSVPGQKWHLNVTGGATALGVDVRDSDASGGKPVRAISSKDSFGNLNWFFEENWSSWIGANGASFHVASNWSPAGVPDATSLVSIQGPNAVNLPSAVTVLDLLVGGSLTAAANLTVVRDLTVLAGGTMTLNWPCVVSNNLQVLADGTLTHSGNASAEINKLDVQVYGDMTVDPAASVMATAKGYASGKGLGGMGGVVGGSYGGRAGGQVVSAHCYGSIVAPTNLGSGGGYAGGGGAVRCTVSGNLRHDGMIKADSGSSGYPTGSGGSIWLTAGTLDGVGSISATAETAGGGGRISLVVTNTGADLGGFIGSVSVRGGGGGYGIGGAGTIYKQQADDRPGRGSVWVDNNGLSGYTDIPPYTNYIPGEVDRAVFYVANAARLRLTNDFTVGDIWLTSTDARLDLNGKTLTVQTRKHELGPGTVVGDEETIIWTGLPPGMIIILR